MASAHSTAIALLRSRAHLNAESLTRTAMRRNRNAKIVATLGPASSSPELIRALFDAGADVFRLNFSHGTHDDHKRRFDAIRAIERDVGRPIGILQDLQGPKIRIGTLKSGPTRLTTDSTVRFRLSSEPGDAPFRCRIRRSCATYCLAIY